MAEESNNVQLTSCCGNPINECLCEGDNSSYVRTDEVCGIVEGKINELHAKINADIKKLRECIPKEFVLKTTNECGEVVETIQKLKPIDLQNLSAGTSVCIDVPRTDKDPVIGSGGMSPSTNPLTVLAMNTKTPDSDDSDTYYKVAETCVEVVNDECYPVTGTAQVDVPFNMNIEDGVKYIWELELNIDGAGWADFAIDAGQYYGGDTLIAETFTREFRISVPANTTKEVCFRLLIAVEGNGDSVMNEAGIGLVWNLN